MEILSSRHSSIHSAAKLSYKNVADIYPKQLPEVYYYYPMDDYGFSPMEKVSLRKAWVMIEPFLHRFSKEISLRFFTANELEIEKFRLSGVLQLNILHNHVLNFMKLLGRLINTIYTPAVFRSVLDENIRQLARRGIHTSHLVRF
ncbi:uncharacterized protein LOC108604577 isoform X2 [Drosophila busckii]|uniref:uncharacterized protein LOC108604577 isoform X2 n=1 Tax=Drosophila busckii TaxID=30019 RepID=UPI00083EA1B5|nr:uncharacterized protein LOC108604577 isoform X2 [Drosophila busckii]